MRRLPAAAFAACAFVAALTVAADARVTYDLRAGGVSFFADAVALVAHDRVRIAFANGLHAEADAAYADLTHNRIVLAGHAVLQAGSRRASGDAAAVDLESGRVDILDATAGARETTLALGTAKAVPIAGDRFAFPELEERRAYIRARRAEVTAHANVRLLPANFPNSPGAVPVPAYLYTYAANPSFGANSLGGATFDQPYGIFGTTNQLLAADFRYESGIGPTVALQDHLVDDDTAYLVTSIDSPQRADRLFALNGYERLGPHLSQTITAEADHSFGDVAYSLTGALGRASSTLSISIDGPDSYEDLSVRSPDAHFWHGWAAHVRGDYGLSTVPGGVFSAAPDPLAYETAYHRIAELYLASPLFKLPLGTTLQTTYDYSRTWYNFPTRYDAFTGNATLSKRLSKQLSMIVNYAATYDYDIYFNGLQGRFYPPVTEIAPDGTPWPGYDAFTGASEYRGVTASAYYAPRPDTSLRLTLATANDFPQFHGYGRAPDFLSFDLRLRPLPNVGIDLGRGDQFGWGGQRYTEWTFAVLP
jgi:hypothetical protein